MAFDPVLGREIDPALSADGLKGPGGLVWDAREGAWKSGSSVGIGGEPSAGQTVGAGQFGSVIDLGPEESGGSLGAGEAIGGSLLGGAIKQGAPMLGKFVASKLVGALGQGGAVAASPVVAQSIAPALQLPTAVPMALDTAAVANAIQNTNMLNTISAAPSFSSSPATAALQAPTSTPLSSLSGGGGAGGATSPASSALGSFAPVAAALPVALGIATTLTRKKQPRTRDEIVQGTSILSRVPGFNALSDEGKLNVLNKAIDAGFFEQEGMRGDEEVFFSQAPGTALARAQAARSGGGFKEFSRLARTPFDQLLEETSMVRGSGVDEERERIRLLAGLLG